MIANEREYPKKLQWLNGHTYLTREEEGRSGCANHENEFLTRDAYNLYCHSDTKDDQYSNALTIRNRFTFNPYDCK